MDLTELQPMLAFLYALLAAGGAAGGAYAAVNLRLHYLEKTLDRHELEFDGLRRELKAEVRALHKRIDQVKA